MRSTRRSPPPDLAAGTVTGSLPGSAAETDATNQLNGSGGLGTLTYALVSGGNAATAGTFGTIQVNAERQLRLHADQAVRHQPGRQQRRQHGGGGELHLQGDRRRRQQRDRHHHGQHRRRRTDGAVDSGNVNEGALLTVTASGVLSNDVAGADGLRPAAGWSGLAAGSDLDDGCDAGSGRPLRGCSAR